MPPPLLGSTLHLGSVQSSIGQGKRSSSATAYLDPVVNRTNLDILLNTLATKVQPSNPNASSLNMNIVEIANTSVPSGQFCAVGLSTVLNMSQVHVVWSQQRRK